MPKLYEVSITAEVTAESEDEALGKFAGSIAAASVNGKAVTGVAYELHPVHGRSAGRRSVVIPELPADTYVRSRSQKT